MSTTPLTLSFAGQQPLLALPQVPGTRGPVGVDMRGLNQSGFCSYDPGFANTAGCQSAISWIDTENSVLPKLVQRMFLISPSEIQAFLLLIVSMKLL